MNPDLNNIWKCQNWFRTRWIRSWWYQGRHPSPVILPDQATFDLLKLRSGRLRMISGSSFIWLRMERSYGDDDNNDNEIAVQGDFCLRVFSTRHLWTLVWVWMSSPARPQCLPGYLDSFWVEIVILMTKETLYCINLQMHQQSWSQLQLILNYSDDLRTFWKTLGKKVLFGSKTVFLWQEVHYYMVYGASYTELIWQLFNYAQKWRICREITNTCLTKVLWPFLPSLKGCHPGEVVSEGQNLTQREALTHPSNKFKLMFFGSTLC